MCLCYICGFKRGLILTTLAVSNLSCIKQDRVLFENLDWTLEPNTIMHLVGDNGAGKTSLLRIVAGLSDAAEGEVLWNGENITHAREDYFSDMVYLGHKVALNGWLTPVENLEYWANLQGLGYSIDYYGLLTQMGLVGLEDIPVRQLSAGQQRRVSLCRLLMKSAILWILDEPFNALDVAGRELLQRMLEQHVANGGMILLTSHHDLETTLPIKKLHLEYRI